MGDQKPGITAHSGTPSWPLYASPRHLLTLQPPALIFKALISQSVYDGAG